MNFDDLEVYKHGIDLAMRIFVETKRFPKEEKYSLTDQIRRSSRSVCTNIAEAWRKRRYPAAFIAKITDSQAEAAETQSWLEIAYRCGYIQNEFSVELCGKYETVLAQLTVMSKQADKWII